MALRVWLPLNGTLNNIGISDVTVTNNGATVDNNGKIGKCYYFNASTYIYENSYDWTNFNTSEFSLCCWYKEPSPVASGNSQIICIGTSSGWNNIRIGLLRRTSNGYPMFSVSDGTSAVQYSFTATSFTFDTWNHIAVTYNNGQMSMYINGILNKTSTTTITPVLNSSQHLGIGAASNGAEKLTGYLNDVRIYDHCLSPKEVKEISQGLVLHYKLDGWSGGAGDNLAPNTSKDFKAIAVPQYYYFIQEDANFYGLKANDIVTYSLYLKAPTDKKVRARIQFYNTESDRPNIHGNYINAGEEGYSTITWTMTATQRAYSKMQLLIDCNDGTTHSATGYYKELKLEKGSQRTAYTKAPEELGIDITKITDSSGYGNNGTTTNIISTQQDSQRYEISSYLNKKKISCSNGFLTTNDPAFTVSLWFKLYSNITYTAYADLISFTTESYSAQPFRLELCGSPVGQNLMWFRGPSGNTGGFNVGPSGSGWYTLDEWHHIALVSDGNKQYISYFDGQQTNTFNGSSYTWTPTGGVSIGDTAEGTASMSDFRIYATALSDEDILDLYHTPANIDNLGGLHGFEFIENDEKDSIYKNGIISNGKNINYLVNNFAETNTLIDWSIGGTSPTLTNGILTLTGTSPAINSSNFTVNPDDIIVIEIGVQLTQTSTTSAPGIYLGTKYGQSTSTFSYNFTTNKWVVSNTNNTNPYFMNGYNSTDYYHCKTYLLGSNKTIDDIPDAKATNTRTLYAIKLNSDTTTNIRSGYNQNTEMIIKLSDFKIYNLNQHGIIQMDNSKKTGYGYLQYGNFIEK